MAKFSYFASKIFVFSTSLDREQRTEKCFYKPNHRENMFTTSCFRLCVIKGRCIIILDTMIVNQNTVRGIKYVCTDRIFDSRPLMYIQQSVFEKKCHE